MEGIVALLIIVAIALLAAGPIAVILAIILFNKLDSIQRRVNQLESRQMPGVDYQTPPATKPEPVPAAIQPEIISPPPPHKAIPGFVSMTPPEPIQPMPQPEPEPQPELQPMPVETPPVPIPEESMEVAAAMETFPVSEAKSPVKGGLELKIGTTVTLIVGVITVVFGVGFFLKYVIDNITFSKEAKICMVAAGGFISLIIGEILRRRNYEIVARGIAAMGFALLYAAIFGGSRHELFSTEVAFVMSIIVTAATMVYAVGLNEVIIAFLALLGGYLSPIIISSGQNLPMPLFSYVLVLSVGTMGCAMFRRWRAVNWVAMVGTYLLYTAWFEKFYDNSQMTIALCWLSVFGSIYLVLPILNGLVKKLTARAEDVALVVANSVAVYYHLWSILYKDSQQGLAFASAILGIAHLVTMFIVVFRRRGDVKLQAALGVLGSAFIAAAIPMYFRSLQPTLVGWSIEAVVLTFIGIHYRSLWTKVMATIVSAIAAAGLFYHLPLHSDEGFRLIFNSVFGTWAWVSATILLCHGLWRFHKNRDEDSQIMAQFHYVAGLLLLALGCALEWYGYCSWKIEFLRQDQAWFLMGTMIIAAASVTALLTRPVCPKGDFVRMVGVIVAVLGSVYATIAMMGVYYKQFTLLFNVPAAIATVFVASVFYGAWQIKRSLPQNKFQLQLPGALTTMALILVLVLFSEQIYMYWYCRNEYGQSISNWESTAYLYMFMLWAVSGVAMLFAAIQFKKPVLKVLSIIISALSVSGLFTCLPLHSGGDFRFVINQPFMAWICVSIALLIGHGLWRFIASGDKAQTSIGSQFYYTVGILLLTLACMMEWYAHCEYQIESSEVGSSNFMAGIIALGAFLVLSLMTRPLPPQGPLVHGLGVLTILGGVIWTGMVMVEVYYKEFTIFANVPFVIALAFVASILVAAWKAKHPGDASSQVGLSALLVLGALLLLWLLLSEQIYSFWYQRHAENWKFTAQMYMSVMWAVYGAILMIIGFMARARNVRYLSLVVFAVLLGKIFIVDTATLRTEYRITAFITTGLVLVGVSFLYQMLKKKGFFDAMEKQLLAAKDDK